MMTGNEYQELASRTIGNSSSLSKLYHGVFGLASEAGEVAGLLQKVYQGHRLDKDHMKKELGDCLWMIAEICTSSGFDLDDVMETNIEKLEERYPNGFETERSLHRKAGDI
jgi:NTP pyrophosphatase (non-canonical NTP hydrolase)